MQTSCHTIVALGGDGQPLLQPGPEAGAHQALAGRGRSFRFRLDGMRLE